MINPSSLSKKQQIEYATAIAFLEHYNPKLNVHFEVVELGDSPDISCRDGSNNEELKLEVTLLEDRLGDIKYILGKEKIPDEVLLSKAIDFAEDVIPRLIERLKDKLLSSYGKDTALLIRQVGPLWTSMDWQRNTSKILYEIFAGKESNYGKGIWILCSNTSSSPITNDIYCLFDPNNSQIPSPLMPSLPSMGERIVGKVSWETNIPEDFKIFQARGDVDPVIRIPSQHGCEFAILIAFIHDEPEEERENAILHYQAYMNIMCPCDRGTAKLMGNWINI